MEEKKRPHGKPVSREQRAERFAAMEDLLSTTLSAQQSIDQFRIKFKAGQRTAERYLHLVREQWAKEGEPKREEKRAEIERTLNAIARNAFMDGEYSPAVAAQRVKAQMYGLASGRLEVTGADGKPLIDNDGFAKRLLLAIERSSSRDSAGETGKQTQGDTSEPSPAGSSSTPPGTGSD